VLWMMVTAFSALAAAQGILGRDLSSFLVAAAAAFIGPLVTFIYLKLFHPVYLAKGRASAKPSQDLLARAAEVTGDRRAVERMVSRREQVESVGKLMELAGWHVVHFPRQRDLNPLGVDVDIAAQRGGEFYYVKVCTSEAAVRPVDWIAASELKRGAWGLSRKREVSPKDVTPLLVMLDVKPDQSLVEFSRHEKIAMITSSRSQLESTLREAKAENARAFLKLSS